eukprot:tig00020614_g12217.t1
MATPVSPGAGFVIRPEDGIEWFLLTYSESDAALKLMRVIARERLIISLENLKDNVHARQLLSKRRRRAAMTQSLELEGTPRAVKRERVFQEKELGDEIPKLRAIQKQELEELVSEWEDRGTPLSSRLSPILLKTSLLVNQAALPSLSRFSSSSSASTTRRPLPAPAPPPGGPGAAPPRPRSSGDSQRGEGSESARRGREGEQYGAAYDGELRRLLDALLAAIAGEGGRWRAARDVDVRALAAAAAALARVQAAFAERAERTLGAAGERLARLEARLEAAGPAALASSPSRSPRELGRAGRGPRGPPVGGGGAGGGGPAPGARRRARGRQPEPRRSARPAPPRPAPSQLHRTLRQLQHPRAQISESSLAFRAFRGIAAISREKEALASRAAAAAAEAAARRAELEEARRDAAAARARHEREAAAAARRIRELEASLALAAAAAAGPRSPSPEAPHSEAPAAPAPFPSPAPSLGASPAVSLSFAAAASAGAASGPAGPGPSAGPYPSPPRTGPTGRARPSSRDALALRLGGAGEPALHAPHPGPRQRLVHIGGVRRLLLRGGLPSPLGRGGAPPPLRPTPPARSSAAAAPEAPAAARCPRVVASPPPRSASPPARRGARGEDEEQASPAPAVRPLCELPSSPTPPRDNSSGPSSPSAAPGPSDPSGTPPRTPAEPLSEAPTPARPLACYPPPTPPPAAGPEQPPAPTPARAGPESPENGCGRGEGAGGAAHPPTTTSSPPKAGEEVDAGGGGGAGLAPPSPAPPTAAPEPALGLAAPPSPPREDSGPAARTASAPRGVPRSSTLSRRKAAPALDTQSLARSMPAGALGQLAPPEGSAGPAPQPEPLPAAARAARGEAVVLDDGAAAGAAAGAPARKRPGAWSTLAGRGAASGPWPAPGPAEAAEEAACDALLDARVVLLSGAGAPSVPCASLAEALRRAADGGDGVLLRAGTHYVEPGADLALFRSVEIVGEALPPAPDREHRACLASPLTKTYGRPKPLLAVGEAAAVRLVNVDFNEERKATGEGGVIDVAATAQLAMESCTVRCAAPRPCLAVRYEARARAARCVFEHPEGGPYGAAGVRVSELAQVALEGCEAAGGHTGFALAVFGEENLVAPPSTLADCTARSAQVGFALAGAARASRCAAAECAAFGFRVKAPAPEPGAPGRWRGEEAALEACEAAACGTGFLLLPGGPTRLTRCTARASRAAGFSVVASKESLQELVSCAASGSGVAGLVVRSGGPGVLVRGATFEGHDGSVSGPKGDPNLAPFRSAGLKKRVDVVISPEGAHGEVRMEGCRRAEAGGAAGDLGAGEGAPPTVAEVALPPAEPGL